jgi:two-component system response regulator YesN
MEHIVLIADDDHHTLVLLEQVIKPYNVQVIQAEDGEQAMKVLQECTPSIMLLDMLMPRVSGAEVLDYVAQTPRLNQMQVVVISAHRQYEYSGHASRANAYLVKPVRPKDIRDAVQRVISSQSIHDR